MTGLPAAVCAAAICGVVVWLLLKPVVPWLARRAVAQVTTRSSHIKPTPQGGGLVAVPAALAGSVVLQFFIAGAPGISFLVVVVAALLLMALGFWDDTHGLPVVPRFACQFAAVSIAVVALPTDVHIVHAAPFWIERIVLVLAVLWFVNLMNFMDGIDLISACETVSICAGLFILAAIGAVPSAVGWQAATLAGAMIGFAIWNAPPARVFLGDAGSLPIGLLLGLLLIQTASAGALLAALILPLYYLADATLTLLRRMLRGEHFWQPHRQHFYQRALRGNLSHTDVVLRVAGLNLALIVLSIVAATTTLPLAIGAAIVAAVLVAILLRHFALAEGAQA
ncbi:putative undecaprenyl-phosphate N-acetylglucosaminyl 1-phosphate transferase [Variibacter gotjawalensis]|uniref:Putative undecaprenyl-phosphate N-acetylglucosaminyl 1-phosphate transferase n=1 Tax=Variibacter gotjawalensis TaxID=1333996 RepID=A0A0S3PTF6_9BRAD|nr:glycosyl transferase [Variibacter gotjawalensis]NIK49569.1 UDP-N-acetylmuramyl pentapeptide phosphotransferase/UDP-N-acetylglucosamine-1-phosphate transferase [Variibacter gotjawalensis]RZS45580.1 UDP-N-acetylmuramyl pentapeptide phosphotransferase/UDP-N-acetylglucosamine-1-phosphate transferase [Variibacter gotjawalensis]BAT59253.1 putative undecaprenyl-phosphate N-acetylglucosaminyl 1-phosphate transferase [Variibacter gotjawalensis]